MSWPEERRPEHFKRRGPVAASSPEFGTSGTEKSERTAFLQDNADKSQAFPQSAAWIIGWLRALGFIKHKQPCWCDNCGGPC